jgi:predicted DNA-binding transcriptional regulator AlpA
MKNRDDSDLMSKAAVAAERDVSVATLDRWHKRNIGPPRIKLLGVGVRYRRSAYLEWVASQEHQSGGSASAGGA